MSPYRGAPRIPREGVDLDRMMEDYERSLILEALRPAGGVKKKAARLLGISFRSLRYRLEKLGIDDGSSRDEVRVGNCVTIKERSASGDFKETRRCD